MAAKFYGVSLGDNNLGPTRVSTGSSTTSKQFEFSIANTTLSGMSKVQILLALEAIEAAVTQDTDPVA